MINDKRKILIYLFIFFKKHPAGIPQGVINHFSTGRNQYLAVLILTPGPIVVATVMLFKY